MDLMTKDLLINFLFILLSLCLAQILYLFKYSYQLKGVSNRVIAIFPVISIILCMLFPVYVDEAFVWDLRWIPFILGGLYGGYKLGSFLFFIIFHYSLLPRWRRWIVCSCYHFLCCWNNCILFYPDTFYK